MIDRLLDPTNAMTCVIILLILVLFLNIWSHRKTYKVGEDSNSKLDKNSVKLDAVYKTITDTAKKMDKLHQHITNS